MLEAGEYTIGLVCALSTENLAAQEFLDEEHGRPHWRFPHDTNSYFLGRIGKHNVVIAVMPMGEYGTASAAGVAINMLRSFPNIKIGLMVGIGGGAPRLPDRDIRLGDVVVSTPDNGRGGVFQYDFGKTTQEKKFQYTRSLDWPPEVLLAAVARLRSRHDISGHRLAEAIDQRVKKNPRLKRKYGRPPPETDVLFKSNFVHAGGSCLTSCADDPGNLVQRPRRQPGVHDDIAIHYGTIASGNSLIKDALLRDRLADEENVLCFEMEAAGLMNRFPCLVIRGICDYSDSHKSKGWQGFAAMTAAAYAKELLYCLAPQVIQSEQKLGSMVTNVLGIGAATKAVVQRTEPLQKSKKDQAILDWLIDTSFEAQQSDMFSRLQPGTCQWLLESDQFQQWVQNDSQTLYCPGIPGAGKTICSSSVVHYLQAKFANRQDVAIAFIYCDVKSRQSQNIRMQMASVLKQLCQSQSAIPEPVRSLYSKHDTQQTKPQSGELFEALEAVTAMFSKTYLVVDALDEWQDMESDRSIMLRGLLGLQERTGLNLFATSRPVEDINQQFRGNPSLEISALEADIGIYVDAHQCVLPGFVPNTPGLLDRVKRVLAEASHGMFLVAQLYLKELQFCISVEDLENTLGCLLKRSQNDDRSVVLGRTYDEAIERVFSQNTKHKDLALKVLSWIAFARAKLTTVQVQHALAVKFGDDVLNSKGIVHPNLMVSVCCGLATIDETSNIIRLVHYTAQEYLEDNQSRLFPRVHAYLAKQCIYYMSLQAFQKDLVSTCLDNRKLHDRLIRFPLYEYCSNFWGFHARQAVNSNNAGTTKIILQFLNDRPKVQDAMEALRFNWSEKLMPPSSSNGLHFAACLLDYRFMKCHGHHDVIRRWLLESGAAGNACLNAMNLSIRCPRLLENKSESST